MLKLCAEHPDTGCYDGSPDTGSDTAYGGPVLSLAIDSFETAYRNYNDAEYADDATDHYCDEWPTWIVAMRRFGHRESFKNVWNYVQYEYGKSFQDCMNQVIQEPANTPLSAPPPPKCRMDVCEYRVRSNGATKGSAQ